jgi:hypothetical protein
MSERKSDVCVVLEDMKVQPPHIAACTEKQIISLLVINLLQIITIREPERLISYPRWQEMPYFYANRRSVIVFTKACQYILCRIIKLV